MHDLEPPLARRISTAHAAIYLGVTRRHIEKLIRSGVLEAWDVSLPGAKRARFSVLVSSVRVLLLARARKHEKQAESTAPHLP